MSQFVVVLEVN